MREIFLGIIQGVTEFLPVSSSGHLALIQYFFPGMHDSDLLLDILLHVGTLCVVLIYYRREILAICRAACSYLPGTRWQQAPSDCASDQWNLDRQMALLIIVGSIPTAIIGLALKSLIEQSFSSLRSIGIALLITGLMLYLAERMPRPAPAKQAVSVRDALIIGTVQGIAIFPGISRSGSTISAGILPGIERKLAAQYSFLLSVPAILGAVALEGNDLLAMSQTPQMLTYALATGVACLTGYVAIATLIKLVIHKRLSWFSWYCWVVGALALIVSVGMLS